MANLMGKTRPKDQPYSTHYGRFPDGMPCEWRVLKHYQTPEREAANPYARVYTWAVSPATGSSGEYGDMYWRDIKTASTVRPADWPSDWPEGL